MRFSKHLFISYAHIDNQPLTPEQQGWITRFHASIEALLSMRMGDKARIWRDDKLQGNDVFADEILDQFAHTAVLLSVLTPRYLNSKWCTREVVEFCKSAEQNGGIIVENKARIFKILKTPVDTEESLPALMKDLLGYEFFTVEDGTPLELDPAYGEKYAQDYNRKVGKLAWDISLLLKKLETDVGDSGYTGRPAVKTAIYLAECSYDRKETREFLEGELRRYGYTILPDRRLPQNENEYVEAVKCLLERCRLAIHLVGESYGAVPDGPSQKSVVVLQNKLAVDRSKISGLHRVIWLPEGTNSEYEPNREFIKALHQDTETQFGADLITGDFENLKTSIHAALKRLEKPEVEHPEEKATTADRAKLVYLICNEKDRKATIPIRKFCIDQGFYVSLPAFQGDATAIREAHQKLLTNCDAVILFYGSGDEAWKRTLDSELKKIPGYKGGKPLPAIYTYLAHPRTADKDDLSDMEEPNLINGYKDFSETKMASFARAIHLRGAIQ